MPTTKVSELHTQLCDVLDRVGSWSRQLAAVPELSGTAAADSERLGAAIAPLRTRAASALINVAMFGAFSSGKSFLVSGLQGRLEVIEIQGTDGLFAEKFIGLLPSSPEPASACPAQVVPVEEDVGFDTSGNGFLRARFIDSAEWQEIGNSPAPAVVAAYAMASADVSNRLPRHRTREVVEVEILLSNFMIPAKLYDLPGYGSPLSAHDTIIKTAMHDADCFIYVARANRTLAEEDLDLIRALYDHCRAWKKRVIWVLTGIDTATQLNHLNIPAWRTIIDRNTRYLEENFTKNGQPDADFVGEGFIPVSPAAEARAARYAADGNSRDAGRHQAASQMEYLRLVLRNIIEQESGRKHVAEIAGKARSMVAPLANAVRARLQEERLPLDAVISLMAAQQESLQRVDAAIPILRIELDNSLRDRVKRASRPFDDLGRYLHSELDAKIRDTDIRAPRKANYIQVARTQALQTWLDEPSGVAELGEAQLGQFKQDVIGWMRRNLGTEESVGELRGSRFSIENLDLSLQQARRGAGQDIVGRTAAVLGIAAPIAASAVWIGSALGASVVFPPAAIVAGAAGLVYMGVQLFKKKITSLEVMQREWVTDIDNLALAVKDRFELSMGSQCTAMIDAAADNLASYRRQLAESMARMRDRIADPGFQMRQGFVDQVAPLSEEAGIIMESLNKLADLV
jgi:hypothetical protein